MLENIPKHSKCSNCGACCGPIIPISKSECSRIKDYIKSNKDYVTKVKKQNKNKFICKFRDSKNKSCAIYPVRPLICKLMGVVKGMQCENGNSYNLDGYKFFKDEPRDIKYMDLL